MQVSLVPAYDPCTAPNSTHGAPLAFSSCTPPQQASAHLTTGTPDANGRSVRMSAALSSKVVSGDVQIHSAPERRRQPGPHRLHRLPARRPCRCGSPTSSTPPTRAAPAPPPRSPSSMASRSPARPIPAPPRAPTVPRHIHERTRAEHDPEQPARCLAARRRARVRRRLRRRRLHHRGQHPVRGAGGFVP